MRHEIGSAAPFPQNAPVKKREAFVADHRRRSGHPNFRRLVSGLTHPRAHRRQHLAVRIRTWVHSRRFPARPAADESDLSPRRENRSKSCS